MSERSTRVAQIDVVATVARAVADEQERIRELDPAMLNEVVGGAGDTPPTQGPTMGMIDPPSGNAPTH